MIERLKKLPGFLLRDSISIFDMQFYVQPLLLIAHGYMTAAFVLFFFLFVLRFALETFVIEKEEAA